MLSLIVSVGHNGVSLLIASASFVSEARVQFLVSIILLVVVIIFVKDLGCFEGVYH